MHIPSSISLIMISALTAWAVLPPAAAEENVHALLHASRTLVGEGDLQGAVDKARQAVEADPAFFDAWKQYGRAATLNSDYAQALGAFEKAWALNPSWRDEAAGWRIQTMLHMEQYERFHLLIESVPDEELKLVSLEETAGWLDTLLMAGWEEVAVTLARRRASLVDDPAAVSLLHALADIADYETETVPDAVTAWAASSRTGQVLGGMLYHHTARRAVNRDDTARAHILLDKALAVDPQRLTALGDKGWVYVKEGAAGKAAQTWEEGIELGVAYPETWTAWIHAARAGTNSLTPAETLAEMENPPPAFDLKHPELTALRYEAMNDEELHDVYQQLLERVRIEDASSGWTPLILAAERTESSLVIDELLAEGLASRSDAAVIERLTSYQMRRKGKNSDAIRHARTSLALNPAQSSLRAELFHLLAAEGRYKEAGIQVVRIENRMRDGEDYLMPLYAELLVQMGRRVEGTEIWASVRSRSPRALRYALEASRYLEAECRTHDAVDMLSGLLASGETGTRVYAYLGEMASAAGNYRDAVAVVDQGLSNAPAPILMRQRAELSEINFDWEGAREHALRYLEHDPGYVPMERLASRAMLALKQYPEVIDRNLGLIERNPGYLQGYVDLRHAYTRAGDIDAARECAAQYANARPGDPEGIRRLAVSLAETRRMAKGLALINRLADLDIGQAIPVVMFRSVNTCNLRGRSTLRQAEEQLRALADTGRAFVTPDRLADDPEASRPRVMVVIEDPDVPAFEALDNVLKDLGKTAVLAVDIPSFRRALQQHGAGLSYEDAVASGRWFPATRGPASLTRVRIREDGLLGNPLTHRIMVDGRRESPAEMEQRLDALLAEAAQELPQDFPVLVYPFGDYGQLSLDCTPDELQVLRDAVARHFKAAIAHDDNGFVIPGFDPLTIPAKSIPAEAFLESTTFEGAASLPDYLKPRNPVLRAKFDEAKMLYWHRQHHRANERFAEVYELGADPASVLYNWGANAFRQGDLPTALDRLREARSIGSLDQENILDALYRVEEAKSPRLELRYSGWEDSDDRTSVQAGASFSFHLRDDLQLGVFLDQIEHERDGLGSEAAWRAGVDGIWYFLPERRVSASVWLMDFDSAAVSDHAGGSVTFHAASRLLNGYAEIGYTRDQVQTIEAVREEVLADSVQGRLYGFAANRFDIYVNGDYIARTDENGTWYLGGRVLYRIMDWPYAGIGYRGRIGDSDWDTGSYYAPQELERHTAFLSLRGSLNRLALSLSGEWGQSREDGTDWIEVWSANAQGEVRVIQQMYGFCGVSHLETPTYELDTFNIGLHLRF